MHLLARAGNRSVHLDIAPEHAGALAPDSECVLCNMTDDNGVRAAIRQHRSGVVLYMASLV